MGKHRLRSKVKSIIGSHIDVGKEEELKGTNIETEDNYEKILALLRGNDEDAKIKLAALIMEFHKQYRSVYERYSSITGKLRAKVRSKRQDYSSSSSSSDSDSSKKASNIGTSENELLNENRELKSKLEETHSEKTGLMLEKEAAMGAMEEEKRRNEELRAIVLHLKREKDGFLSESKDLKMELRVAESENARLNKSIKEMAHKDKMIKELENTVHVKEEEIVKLGEEKREAIRQLCMWVDYQRDRYKGLRQLLSNKVAGRRRQTAT